MEERDVFLRIESTVRRDRLLTRIEQYILARPPQLDRIIPTVVITVHDTDSRVLRPVLHFFHCHKCTYLYDLLLNGGAFRENDCKKEEKSGELLPMFFSVTLSECVIRTTADRMLYNELATLANLQ